MTPAETVIAICQERGIGISRLEKDCGFSNGYLKGRKSGKLPPDRIRTIAEYLRISAHTIDPETFPEYYIDPETAAIAQAVYDDPDLRVLFDAARDADPKNIQLAAEMLRRFKETNPDG